MRFLNRLFGKTSGDETPADELDHWVIAKANNEKNKARVVFRLRTSRPPIDDIDAYATGISIQWVYCGADSGMPTGDVNASQRAFEEGIEDLTMYNGWSFLMLVSTGMDEKEWLFYAKDRNEFMTRLNRALQDHPKYPLKIKFYDDPEWKLWNQILSGLIDKNSQSNPANEA